jgi:hypothetical protein
LNCRHCKKPLLKTFLDLGYSPPSNAYLNKDELSHPEAYFPLKITVCQGCWLVQTEDYAEAGLLFTDQYAYFSSASKSWLDHAKSFSEEIIEQLGLTGASFVIEVASNDGYLLRNFVDAKIPCLGIEPTASTAIAAEKLNVPVFRTFFSEEVGKKLATQGQQADLIVGNNVYAHVPDINDFTLGLKAALKPGGTITLEFPHLMQLLAGSQFDTVYHEHFSYLSLMTVVQIFTKAGLRIWRVEQLRTHGGSLRIFGCHGDDEREPEESVRGVILQELEHGLNRIGTYLDLQKRAEKIKADLIAFLVEKKRAGKTVAAYGAAAKGNTLLNFAGIKPDLLPVVCDAALSKQGKFMPGSHIPILPPQHLLELRPDYVLILPWNIAEEVLSQESALKNSGTQFLIAIPRLQML